MSESFKVGDCVRLNLPFYTDQEFGTVLEIRQVVSLGKSLVSLVTVQFSWGTETLVAGCYTKKKPARLKRYGGVHD